MLEKKLPSDFSPDKLKATSRTQDTLQVSILGKSLQKNTKLTYLCR